MGTKTDQGSNLAPHFQLDDWVLQLTSRNLCGLVKSGGVCEALARVTWAHHRPQVSASPPPGEELVPLATSLPRGVHPDDLGLRVPRAPRSRARTPASLVLFRSSPLGVRQEGELRLSTALTQRRKGLLLFFFKIFFDVDHFSKSFS